MHGISDLDTNSKVQNSANYLCNIVFTCTCNKIGKIQSFYGELDINQTSMQVLESLYIPHCKNGRLLVVLYSFIEERRWLIRVTLMLIYPLRIYTSCIPHVVDNNIIHVRGCGKTDLLLL